MLEAVRSQYEAFPDPSPAAVPVGPGQLDRIDDSLHFGWSWSRYRYCFRQSERLRVLDAGCGTGLTTLGLARLNPGSTVLGLDASPRSLEMARERARASGVEGVEFRAHDLEQPLPHGWGPFDFVVCRGVLGQAEDAVRVLRNLAAALDPRGLLHVTFPTESGRQPARRLRLAVDALAEPGMSLEERAAIGLEMFQALRPDHPIRRYESGITGAAVPDSARFITGYLGASERLWTLKEINRILDEAGLQFLYAATRWPWQPERVLAPNAAPESLKARVARLSPHRLAELSDALDPALHLDEYRVYACLADFEPRVPGWVEESQKDPEVLGRLIPHRTGLARADPSVPTASPNRVVYHALGGALGELDQRSHLLLEDVNDIQSCLQINDSARAATGVTEPPGVRRDRWLDLTNRGFVVLESPDPREHHDCQHLGAILDRLDCPCPRRWLRACELHGVCSIAVVNPDDENFAAWSQATHRLKLAKVAFCAECPDYLPEEE